MDSQNRLTTNKGIKQKTKRFEKKYSSIYSKCLITRSISIPITAIGKNIQETIEKNISILFENKCIAEGFIKKGSSRVITYSSGVIKSTNVIFEVVFEAMTCCLVEGTLVNCVAINITKAGIRAESSDEIPSPITVFITRDHHYMMEAFSNVKEGDRIMVRVIGQRFELNDEYISVIGELVENKK